MIQLMLRALLAVGLHYHPVEPCRVIDTRVPSTINMAIPTNGIVTFLVSGDGSRVGYKNRGSGTIPIGYTFADQGGAADGCGIPRTAAAVALNVKAIPERDGAGHLRIWRYAVAQYLPFWGTPMLEPPPETSAVNWSAGQTVVSGLTVAGVCVEATAPFNDCNEDLAITARGVPTHVVVDVEGYFEE